MSRNIAEIIAASSHGASIGREDLETMLALESESGVELLRQEAYRVKLENVGNKVFFRGIIEFSNICEKDCLYCGIRKGNQNVRRFRMTGDELLAAADWAYQNGYGSIVLQSGEVGTTDYVDFVERALLGIKKQTGGRLGVTLSLGEQSEGTYRRWFQAGAHRYLLRIETSNPKLYSKLHPADHDFERRKECLLTLRSIGYQVGTGVMIGLPFQTIGDLADDILFFRDMDVDMIGMGPYLVHNDTPLAAEMPDFESRKASQLKLGLKMISATRIFLKDVNIASTTALQALDDKGREFGLLAGANIIMPNVTDVKYRSLYQLYENKPCVNESSDLCKSCLQRRIESIGETIGLNEWGDSPHHAKSSLSKN